MDSLLAGFLKRFQNVGPYSDVFEDLCRRLNVKVGEDLVLKVRVRKRGGRAAVVRILGLKFALANVSSVPIAYHEFAHAIQFYFYSRKVSSVIFHSIKSFFLSVFRGKAVNTVKAFEEGFADYVTFDVIGFPVPQLLEKAGKEAERCGRLKFAFLSYNSYVFGRACYLLLEKAFGREHALKIGLSNPKTFKEECSRAQKVLEESFPTLS
jgi:hypothetical protein